jgi:tetratricopeptide (TPR) repeat protein
VGSWEKLVHVYEDKGDDNTAISVWRELVSRQPSKSEFLYRLGKAYERQTGADINAISVWKELTTRGYPNRWEPLYELAKAYGRREEHAACISTWSELVDIHPELGAFQNGLANIIARCKESDIAVARWKDSGAPADLTVV